MEAIIGLQAAWLLKIAITAGMVISARWIFKHIKD